MIRDTLAAEEYYHICHRGNNKQPIFNNDEDRYWFLFLLLYLQAPISIEQLSRRAKEFRLTVQHRMLDSETNLHLLRDRVLAKRVVELVNFTLETNHFHATVYAKVNNGISLYMQKVLNAYTKYVNIRYEKIGHLFQGPYTLVHQKDNDQFLYLSTYIHRNPGESTLWQGREHEYPWSSFQDYIGENRWGALLSLGHVMDQFSSPAEYKKFVEESPAKYDPDDFFSI